MKGLPEERASELAQYIIQNNATVRQAAAKFGISKSTVHKDVTDRLRLTNRRLYEEVKTVLEENKAERHIRKISAKRPQRIGKSEILILKE